MKKKEIVLIGAGGHARACIDVIEQDGEFQIVGLVGKNEEIGSQVYGYEVMSDDSMLLELAKRIPFALITVGQIHESKNRINLFQRATSAGFTLASIRSPRAYVSPKATIGVGTIIMHDAMVNAGAKIGNNCIINSKALIEHDSVISDNCHISTGALINGYVTVLSGSFVGSGSVIKNGISVGENSVVGMGSVIRQDLKAKSRWIEK
jgi:sugar O-acyltransferase (sialic acid O-acetyltransferase NeuD family)